MAINEDIDTFPVPRTAGEIVVPAPGDGPQRWAGAPTALLDEDGATLLAYRVRDDGDRVVLARAEDGERFETITEVTARGLGVAMVERAALVRAGAGWRLYVSCAEPGTKGWWLGLLEARRLEDLATANLRPLALGGPLDAMKDPIVRRADGGWRMWVCRHPLDVPGAEDCMSTLHATSVDGIAWHLDGVVLAGRPGAWDARGARVTSVLPDGRAFYDGRATAEENWFERTGLAVTAGGDGRLRALDSGPAAAIRYLEVLLLPTGGTRLYYEARRADGAYELRTEVQAPEPR
jgi:hypothetical protein